tara:strand:+ start:5485 stop:6348 length:864 start_codon:yes stop_codon:yes gene_type:complete
MKCLVTGGSGFIGSHLVDELIKQNHQITVLDKIFTKNLKNKKIKFVRTNLSNEKQLKKAFKNQDVVFHFGGLSGINESMINPLRTAEYNIMGTIRLLKLAKEFGIKRFIFASTVYVNSEQGSFYKSSKRAAEDFIEEYRKKYKLNFTILRFGTVYGERASSENSIDKILNKALKKKKIIYSGNIKSIREYIHVKDAVKATVKILKKKFMNKYINITGSKKFPVVKALNIIRKELNLNTKIIYENKKEEGHYINTPDNLKLKKATKIKIKKSIPFNIGIREIIKTKKK